MMEDESTQEADPDLQAQIILLAASHHDLESLRPLLRTGSASVQDPETGLTPLHAAIAACEPSPSSRVARNGPSPNENLQNGHTNDASNGHEVDAEGSNIEAATKTLRLLLQNGAIWNDTDNNNETPGCLALRLGLKELYDIMVDAGVRAEMLLNRLDEYEQLAEGEEEEEEEEGADEAEEKRPDAEDVKDVDGSATQEANGHTETRGVNGTAIVPISRVGDTELNNDDYLQSSLRFQDGRILDGSNNGVMMAWESDVMKNTADLLVPKSGLRVLNIGHGMGIIDTFFQERSPSIHHIIEAHPAILSRMKKDGWCERPNVTIHNGRWQDVVPKIMEQGILFDAIYFDTFAEDYKALRDFFNDCILGLLDDGGKWGFFNGLGADRQICYDVYAKVVEMDLFEAGFDTEWETVPVPEMEKSEWEGVKRRYWTLSEYKLPICEFIG